MDVCMYLGEKLQIEMGSGGLALIRDLEDSCRTLPYVGVSPSGG